MSFFSDQDYALFKSRRDQVVAFLRQEFPDVKDGVMVLFSDFENERHVFRQESSFYYLTGINEPGAVLCSYLDGREVLYLPNYGGLREQWVNVSLSSTDPAAAEKIKVTEIKTLGKECGTFSFSPLFTKEKYETFLTDLDNFFQETTLKNGKPEFFTLLDGNTSHYFNQKQIYRNLIEFLPEIANVTRDLAQLVHYLRRLKSEYEIDLIFKAVQITTMAHQAAAQIIEPGRIEHEVQAVIESVFTQVGSLRPAFPSIVATGINTTILHYLQRNQELKSKDLVVIDIGAEYGYYAADLTRTYPVDGKFTPHQLEIYNAVLQTQTYIESIAKVGMFLNNPDEPDKSLNHLATKYLDKLGLSKFIAHGIGHFLGLDVHDVGDMKNMPLAPGDVFTIEPGLYIPKENLGIRIEDDYLMTDEGAVCLSYQLQRSASEIEKLMQEG